MFKSIFTIIMGLWFSGCKCVRCEMSKFYYHNILVDFTIQMGAIFFLFTGYFSRLIFFPEKFLYIMCLQLFGTWMNLMYSQYLPIQVFFPLFISPIRFLSYIQKDELKHIKIQLVMQI